MALSRRHVLATLALVPVAGALGIGGLAWRWWDRPPGAELLALSERELWAAEALAEAWMPPGGEPELSGREAKLGHFLDGLLDRADPTTRRLLKLLLQVLDDATLPSHGQLFRSLPLEDRVQVLRGWLRSDVALWRGAVQGLVLLLSLGWTNHPVVATQLQRLFPCGNGP